MDALADMLKWSTQLQNKINQSKQAMHKHSKTKMEAAGDGL